LITRSKFAAALGALALTGVFQLMPMPASAAPLTVMNNNNTGAGSLRAAVGAAVDGDTITFDPSLNSQTITLTSGEIAITTSITIDATGIAVTLDGNSASRIFNVSGGKTVSLKHLTVQHGTAAADGGAILNAGTLSVSDSIFTSNTTTGGDGAAINSSAALTVTRTLFTLGHASNFSGAIENGGTSLVIDRSSFINNIANDDGGAISNDGTGMKITNSTFAGNTSGGNSGAIWVGGGAAAATISSSTFVSNSTTASETGGAFNIAPVIADSIVANNTGTSSNTPNNCGTTATLTEDKGFNLEFGASTCNFTVSAQSGDPKLGAPKDNGGGLPTAALGTGSAAIDKGTCTDPNAANATITTDERGVPRPQGSSCDIGAFEATTPVVTATPPAANAPNGTYTGKVSGPVAATDPAGIGSLTCTGATLSGVTGLGTASASGTFTATVGTAPVTVTCTATNAAGVATVTTFVLAAAVIPTLPAAGSGPPPPGVSYEAVRWLALVLALSMVGAAAAAWRKDPS
jgi:hypothetical protein